MSNLNETTNDATTLEENTSNEQDEIPISRAVEVVNINVDEELNYAIPCNNEILIIDKSLLITINKLTILLSILNLPYIFTNFAFYLLRVMFIMICRHYSVNKNTICATNIYIGGVLVDIFFIKPLVIGLWIIDKNVIMLIFECFQLPFEVMLFTRLVLLRKKIKRYSLIPMARHSNSELAVATYADDIR